LSRLQNYRTIKATYKKLQHLKICEENVRAAKEQVMLALHQAGGDR
jgi:hypothetical protein